MTAKENKTERLHLLISPSEVSAIDDWGFKNRVRTKGEAVRRLCQIGITYDREIGSSRVHCRKAMSKIATGLRRLLDIVDKVQDIDIKRELLELSGDLLEGGRELTELFQDMAATDSTATLMEEAGDLHEMLQKAAEVRATIDKRRHK